MGERMKPAISLSLAAAAAVTLSSCIVVEPVPDRPYRPDHSHGGGGNGGNYGGAAREARREGYEVGRSDARRGYSSNVYRHRNEVRPSLFDEFADGYREGYRDGSRGGGYNDPRDDDKFGPETFRNGYRYGKLDAERRLSPNYRRHADSYRSKFESSFREGYEKGYRENLRHRR